MSLGLIKPGASAALRHPKTGRIIRPIGYLKNGQPVWPVFGASSDDPDDPAFVGGGDPGGRDDDDDDDEPDDESDDDESDGSKKDQDKSSSKAKKNDDDEDDKPSRPERQAARYRTQLREAQKQLAELQAAIKKRDDADKPADELMKRDLSEAREMVKNTQTQLHSLRVENAFLRANDVQWNDPEDALKLIDLDEVEVDDDGTVDARQLRRALRDLARRKPHLVKKSTSGRHEDQDDDEEQSSKSGSTMNGTRRGSRNQVADRKALAKRFPVLGGR